MFSFQKEYALIDSPQRQSAKPFPVTEHPSQELVSSFFITSFIPTTGKQITTDRWSSIPSIPANDSIFKAGFKVGVKRLNSIG